MSMFRETQREKRAIRALKKAFSNMYTQEEQEEIGFYGDEKDDQTYTWTYETDKEVVKLIYSYERKTIDKRVTRRK
ncbi:hypothetical protein [Priestia endophytica]|uniref:Uncharacterized protein n=1 Tax=Priestia endophytica DSM 13796 TaxID=1121089 RepID=A0A1I6C7F0_9BACI|nr:hypothetical protein [Priestia endophytica]KYG33481.1 hypothetical protein AZF06_21800 [Priestia endophytica]SFQ89108.1 hypothetical protein SAMN02745910_05206 [Priestia endophytica DSM 13796]